MSSKNLEVNLNGLSVREMGGTLFIPLPRELWRSTDGCCCKYCSPEKGKSAEGWWDTLAVPMQPNERGSRHTYTVHMPEIHGKKAMRDGE